VVVDHRESVMMVEVGPDDFDEKIVMILNITVQHNNSFDVVYLIIGKVMFELQ